MAAYTVADLAAHLNQELDTAKAVLSMKVAADVAHSYTRGAGFDPLTGEPGDDLAAVILTAAGRLYGNPQQHSSEQLGGMAARYGVFDGWSLHELAVLNSYRRRAA